MTSVGDTAPPDAPTSLQAIPGDGEVALDWPSSLAPDHATYEAAYKLASEPTVWTDVVPDPVSSSTTVSGLTNGLAYDFRVRDCDEGARCSAWVTASATPESAVAFSRATGLQTNDLELARHLAFGATEPYLSDRAALVGHAVTARNAWPYTITPGLWSGEGSACDPVGQSPSAAFDLRNASTDILAMAMTAAIDGSASMATAARQRILELVAITDFEAADLSGSNECILDLGTAIPNVLEAAWLLEDTGAADWTNADRVALADWLVAEVFPLVSWAPQARKNNWGIVTLRAAIYAAAYVEGGVPSLTLWDTSTTTPAAYLSGVGTVLAEWLSASVGDELDSDCDAAGQVFGLQASGAFPDELRRTGGTANCGAASIAFDCTDSTTCAASGAHFYQHKATAALAGVCEALRRIDGDGARCFDLVSHGGANTVVEDALRFATGGDFQSYYVPDTTQGARYILGEYLEDECILDALDDGDVSVRGGRDVAYSRITHAPGVANLVAATPCPAPPGAFVPVGSSDLPVALQNRLPYNYASATPAIDTSGYTELDVTNTAGGPLAACGNITTSGDQVTAFRCMWAAAPPSSCLYFPNGTYPLLSSPDFDHVLYYDRNSDGRCIRGESEAGVVFLTGGIYPTTEPVNFLAGDNSGGTVWGAAAVTWTGGYTRGTDEITVADASSFAVGEWVYLRADANAVQTTPQVEYHARAQAIVGTTITLDRPLPDDFTGSNPTARRWLPAEGIALERFTVRPAEPDHQQAGQSTMLWLRHTADSHVRDVHLDQVYQYGLLMEDSARNRVQRVTINANTDKNFNNYALAIGGASDNLFLDFLLYNSPQAISCAGTSQGNVFAFFAIVNPEDNQPSFDRACNSGDGNDCNIVDHSGVHAETVGTGFLHCSQNEGDVLGDNGSSSCRGTRTDEVSGSILFHGEACSNSSFVRGYLEGGIWSDYINGAGRNNLLFGLASKAPPGDPPPKGAGIGALGDIGFKDGGSPNGGTYRSNYLLVGSNLNQLGTGSANALDIWMDDAWIAYNVVRGQCRYDGGASPNAQAASACNFQSLADGDVNGVLNWDTNDVNRGSLDRTWSEVLPTAPGFDASIEAELGAGCGSFPWYGADMGPDGGVGANANPAYLRYYGACP